MSGPGLTMDLDPVFIKALRLLHSRSKDSAAQLRKMLDDALASRRVREVKKPPPDETSQSSSSSSKGSSGSKPDFDDIRKREAERYTQKVKSEPDLEPPEPKRPKLFDVLEGMKKEPAVEEKKIKEEVKKKKKPRPISDSESNSEPELGMDDFAMDMGIACVVCRQFDVTNANQLVECQECHNLYHQECHAPKVDSFDLNDPRFVWYCSKCTKLMKKSVTKPVQPKTKSPQPVTPEPVIKKEKEPVVKTSSSSSVSTSAAGSKSDSFTPFRRVEAKSSKSDGSGGKPGLAGLAGMAANLSGKSSEIKPGMRNAEIQKIQKANEAAKKALEMQQQLRDAKIDFSKATNTSEKKKPVVIPKAGASKPVQNVQVKVEKEKVQGGPSVSAATADKRLQMMKKKAQIKSEHKSHKPR